MKDNNNLHRYQYKAGGWTNQDGYFDLIHVFEESSLTPSHLESCHNAAMQAFNDAIMCIEAFEKISGIEVVRHPIEENIFIMVKPKHNNVLQLGVIYEINCENPFVVLELLTNMEYIPRPWTQSHIYNHFR